MAKERGSIFRSIPYLESFRAFLEQWGAWKFITTFGSSVVAIVWGIWAWLEVHYSYWFIALVGLLAFALLAALGDKAHSIWLRHRIRRIDVEKLADDIDDAIAEMRRTLRDIDAATPMVIWRENEKFSDGMMHHHREIQERQQTIGNRFYMLHGGNLMRLARLVHSVTGVETPFHAIAGLRHEPDSMIAYLGAVASLIRDGYIDEIAKMDSHFIFKFR